MLKASTTVPRLADLPFSVLSLTTVATSSVALTAPYTVKHRPGALLRLLGYRDTPASRNAVSGRLSAKKREAAAAAAGQSTSSAGVTADEFEVVHTLVTAFADARAQNSWSLIAAYMTKAFASQGSLVRSSDAWRVAYHKSGRLRRAPGPGQR